MQNQKHSKSGARVGGLFYRRKVLLALIQTFGGRLAKIDLQKLLFLFTRGQDSPSYDFVPYKYGCFSFQCAADKTTLTKYKLIEPADDWVVRGGKNYLQMLTADDQKRMTEAKRKYGRLRGNRLVKSVYLQYPYFATKSEIARSLLTADEFKTVTDSVYAQTDAGLFTIGYEGKSLEEYLNQLIRKNVKVVCDVRRNPLSMKFGFSKNQLKSAAEGLGMAYVHLPQLGIESSRRKNLQTLKDYEDLFQEYERVSLPKQMQSLQQIVDLVREQKRVALTCFEASAESCHRGRVAKALRLMKGWTYPTEHI